MIFHCGFVWTSSVLQSLEYLWDHGNLFEIWVVRATEYLSWRQGKKEIVSLSCRKNFVGTQNEFELVIVNEPSLL